MVELKIEDATLFVPGTVGDDVIGGVALTIQDFGMDVDGTSQSLPGTATLFIQDVGMDVDGTSDVEGLLTLVIQPVTMLVVGGQLAILELEVDIEISPVLETDVEIITHYDVEI